MPSRVIREGIIDSIRIERLVRDGGWPAECFYRRLHQVVDDYGRFDGRVSMIRARCYPTLLDLVREVDVQRWIAACEKAGLIRLYTSQGRACLDVLDFRQHARSSSKYPNPPSLERGRGEVNGGCTTDAVQTQRGCSPNAEAHCEGASSEAQRQAAPASAAVAPPPAAAPPARSTGPPVMVFECVRGKKSEEPEWALTAGQLAEWAAAFEGTDVAQCCREALAWVRAKPANRKTADGMEQFLFRWIKRDRDRGKNRIGGPPVGGNGHGHAGAVDYDPIAAAKRSTELMKRRTA